MTVLLDTGVGQLNLASDELPAGTEIGQLLTPLTRRADFGQRYGIDNGCYAGFNRCGFESLLKRQWKCRDRCLFVVSPDVVCSARRTLEVFSGWYPKLHGWPVALAIQNGQEDLPIPWDLIAAVFIGGDNAFKMSAAAAQIIRAAQLLGKWVHVGRVNSVNRFDRFLALGVDSIDGTGLSRFSWMRRDLNADSLFMKRSNGDDRRNLALVDLHNR